MKPHLRLVLPLLVWFAGFTTPKVGAHVITVDGSSGDWFGTVASSANLGRICRNAAGQGEYVWRDASGDERTDFSSPDSGADITSVRVTGSTNGLFIFVGTSAAPSSDIQVQVTIDLDRVAGSGQNYLAGYADTMVDDNVRWECLIQTHFTSGGTAVLLDTDFNSVATLTAARGDSGFEMYVAWTNLGLAGIPAAPLRFTVATFRSDTSDQTLDIGGSSVANALDVVTTYGNPGTVANTWTEVSDQVINYYFDVYFQTNAALPGEVYAPVLVDKFVVNSTTLYEMVAVRNVSPVPVNLGRFKVGDEETVDAGEGMYFFPTNTTLAANGVFTVAERSLNFIGKLGYAPDGEFNATTNTVPDMVRYTIWATGVWALSNTGDEILVLDGSDTIVDVVAYGTGSYSGITAITAPGSEQMLRRLPANGDTDNCSTDFVNVGAPGAPLKILTCAVADSLPCLAWQEVAGDYTVEMRTNLLTGSWQAAPGTTWPISTCAWTSSVPATAAQAFYHVKRN